MHDTRVQEMSLRRLQQCLDDGLFAIPKLQREFVWNGTKAAALMDSIHRGMPIGSLLVWDTERRNQDVLRHSLHILPEFNRANPRVWFVIDGQQRLSVIHQARRGERRENSDGRVVDFSRINLVLKSPREVVDNGFFNYRKALEGEHAPVHRVLASNWRSWFRDLSSRKQRWIQDCRTRHMDYRVPVVFIRTDNLDEIQEVFVRINALGTKISSADSIFASASALDLRAMAHELRESLPEGFRSIARETLLLAFMLVAEPAREDVGERAYRAVVRRWNKEVQGDAARTKAFLKLWSRMRRAIGRAVEYLATQFSVHDQAFLPSANMLATLSVFFFHAGQPRGRQRTEIAKWFWATAVAQRYSGAGYRHNILADARLFRRLARRGGRFRLADRIDANDLRRTAYNGRSSLSAAFMCLLGGRGPRFIENGELIPAELYASPASRRDRHHIFPRALLATMGFHKREYNSICNICLIVAEENQSFGSKRPASYLEPFRPQRHFSRAMRSHLIPHRSEFLWQRGIRRAFPRFIRERQDLIAKEFERAAGMKLFRTRS
jgi:hypothetical protein